MKKQSRHDDIDGEEFTPPALPIAADGGIAATPLEGPAPLPERSPEHFICLRGPCRHYWHLVTMAQEGNPASTWAELGIEAPRQHHHTCLVNPGFETDFGDDCAYECNKWDPMQHGDLVQLERRRNTFYEKFPELKPEENKND